MHNAKPNILFIMADEHNAKIAGFSGNPLARTPSIDRLAAEGIVFDSAYCNSPLCAPSRHSFTAGKYIHRVSAWSNSCWIADDNIASIARVMTAAGYDSLLCGKQHYDSTRRYGFTEIGGNMNGSLMTGLGGRRDPDDETIDHAEAQVRFAGIHEGADSPILHHDRAVTRGVLDCFSARGRSDRPFFLFAGFVAPHFPLIVPPEFVAKYKGRIPLPEIPPGHLEQLPLNYKHLRRGFGTINVPDEITLRGRELYYGLTEWVDQEIGRVLEGLRQNPFAENTIVIYASDHGENMGEHGMWWKNCMFESATRIPLIIQWSERWKGGQRRVQVCSLLDLMQTVAELGSAEIPHDWDGHSLASLLDDPGTEWKDTAIAQYYGHNIASGYAMIRQGAWKYVYHSAPRSGMKPERELYDLSADPCEFRNLAHDLGQRERIDNMESALIQELGEHPDETEQRARAELSVGYGRA